MTAKITTNNTRNLPPMLGEPIHFINTRCGTDRLLRALLREHRDIIDHLRSKQKGEC